MPDILVDIPKGDYVLTDIIIDPVTNGNINTYILKDNIPVKFKFGNISIEPKQALLSNYYYRTIKNTNIKIRNYEIVYLGDTDINIVPERAYTVLKATRRLSNCIFIFDFTYNVVDETAPKNKQFAFKIVSEKEFKMYNDIEVLKSSMDELDKNGEIKRPKKQE